MARLLFGRCLALLVVTSLLGIATSAERIPSSAILNNIFTSVNFTGASSVRIDEGSVYNQAFGFQDFHNTVAMQNSSRFRIGSNTKLFTAIALWQLHERGLIDMTQNIGSYLDPNDYAAFGVQGPYCPQFQLNQCQIITFIDLLGMTSCITNSAVAELLPYSSVAQIIGQYYFNTPLACQPGGTTFYYSNAGYVWATYFVEKLTGLSYAEYIKQYITGPLNMDDTYFDPYDGEFGADWKKTEEYVMYLDNTTKDEFTRGRCNMELNLGAINGAGGIISTVGDLATLWYSVFNFTASTSPVFIHQRTMYQLIKPHVVIQSWNATHTRYYSQGLIIIAANMTQVIPNLITYQGQLMCSLTSNLMFIPGARADAPKTLVQAWTSVKPVYATAPQLRQIVAAEKGSAFDILNQFAVPYQAPANLAWQVAELLGFPESP